MVEVLLVEEKEIFNREQEKKIIMSKQDIIKILQKFGLNEYEAKAYFALLNFGSAKAGAISLKSEVPQSKVYSVLQNLMSKQLVEMLDGRPKEFRAVPPEIAFRTLIVERQREIKELSEEISVVSKLIKSEAEKNITSGIWTIRGKKWKEFFNKVAEMIDRSEKYVYGVTKNYSFTSRLAQAVKSAVRRGVKVRVIGLEPLNQKNYLNVKWYVRFGAELKYFRTNAHPRIVVVDGKEVLLRLDYDPSKLEGFSFSSMWSGDESFTKVFDSYVKNLWKISKPIIISKDIPSPS
jgi:sugar-specific transcriptional regulator TrmB